MLKKKNNNMGMQNRARNLNISKMNGTRKFKKQTQHKCKARFEFLLHNAKMCIEVANFDDSFLSEREHFGEDILLCDLFYVHVSLFLYLFLCTNIICIKVFRKSYVFFS